MTDANYEIKVSVCVVTYNQEDYIRECLQSLVTQETDFNFEIIVSDDCSTDKTPQIINEFYERYPTIIRPILHKENMGPYKNFIFVHSQASGKYIAHMDGDDYALPRKLQIQADFLDMHCGCNLVWTHVLIETPQGTKYLQNKFFRNFVRNKKFYKGDLIRFGTLGCNSTKMYRRKYKLSTKIDFPVIDYYMNIENVGNGYACFVNDEPLGGYRIGQGIASSGLATRKVWINNIFQLYKKNRTYRRDFNHILLTILISDILHKRKTLLLSFYGFINTYHYLSVYDLLKNYKYVRSFTLEDI